MTERQDAQASRQTPPPIRNPVLFYACVLIAFGLLGAATIALTRL